jgi:hypothetical protein
LFFVGLFECDRGVPAAGTMHERVTNVAVRIPRGFVRIGRA